MREHPLAQSDGKLCLESRDAGLRSNPAQQVEPCCVLVALRPEGCAYTIDRGLVGQRRPQVGRTLNDAVTEEARRHDADNCEGVRFNIDGGADDGRIAGEV